ncbi:MAG: fimbrillin family protein [Prevotella ruminicola]|uniref:Fimbrillin family protein n=1 Tax=Xylanibacter ruminicola TaxID=839 RepID=A0A9D5SB32_XYLRU|nr:fimbrillin family protein [Xylanibacter ruminicola]MBE7728010.1 fimbrillin family protein [Enterocloster citroniae]
MRKVYLIAAAVTMFAACSSNDKLDVGAEPQQPVAGAEVPVGFDAYTQRGLTRAGVVDVTNDAAIQAAWDGATNFGGFGVFAYYTDNNEYDQLATPNFMYNQHVTYSTDHWTYEPVKYWPNEYGTSAISDDADKVSFFAYAPYVKVVAASGKLEAENAGGADATYGITGMTRNTASGDPVIKYIGSFDSNKSVDLCWGVCNTTSWPRVNDGNHPQSFVSGLPWLNVERPQEAVQIGSTSTQNVKFQFMHALAKLKFTVNAFVDGTDATNALAAGTKIWIRSIRFTGFAMKGALNLNNETPNQPYWLNYNGIGDLESDGEVIVYDGRKDGKEGVNGSEASNEKSLGLNKQFVETEASFNAGAWATTGDHYEGVTNAERSLFDGTGVFYAIPTDDNLEIEIVYDVETIDGNLGTKLADNATAGSSIENRISKKISFGGTNSKLEAGKGYVINLHLGMNDVNFDAAVANWEDVTPSEVDLPANVPFYAAAAAGTGTATIPFDATSIKFGINNLNGGEAIAETVGANKWNDATNSATVTAATALATWDVTNNNANASGYCVQTLTTTENPSTSNRTQVWTWQGSQSAYKVEMTFTQLAHPIELQAPAVKTHGTTAQLVGGFTNAYGFFCKGLADDCAVLAEATNGNPEAAVPANGIVVYRNGTKLTLKDTPAAAGDYSFTDLGLITFQEATQTGDLIKVVLKTGDAAVETVSWIVE